MDKMIIKVPQTGEDEWTALRLIARTKAYAIMGRWIKDQNGYQKVYWLRTWSYNPETGFLNPDSMVDFPEQTLAGCREELGYVLDVI